MARTPFLPQYNGYAWGLSSDYLNDDLKALIAKPIVDWPYVEHQMAMTLGLLLKADTPASIALFSTLKQSRKQHEAIRVAAQATVRDSNDLNLVLATLRFLRTAESARNDFAHGCWGGLRTNPMNGYQVQDDMAIWIETKHYAPLNVSAVLSEINGIVDPPHKEIEKHLSVYKRTDLAQVCDLIDIAFQAANHLTGIFNMLSRQKVDLADQSRDSLRNLPPIRQYLAHLSADQSNLAK